MSEAYISLKKNNRIRLILLAAINKLIQSIDSYLQLKGCCPKTIRKKNLDEALICILQKFMKAITSLRESQMGLALVGVTKTFTQTSKRPNYGEVR